MRFIKAVRITLFTFLAWQVESPAFCMEKEDSEHNERISFPVINGLDIEDKNKYLDQTDYHHILKEIQDENPDLPEVVLENIKTHLKELNKSKDINIADVNVTGIPLSEKIKKDLYNYMGFCKHIYTDDYTRGFDSRTQPAPIRKRWLETIRKKERIDALLNDINSIENKFSKAISRNIIFEQQATLLTSNQQVPSMSTAQHLEEIEKDYETCISGINDIIKEYGRESLPAIENNKKLSKTDINRAKDKLSDVKQDIESEYDFHFDKKNEGITPRFPWSSDEKEYHLNIKNVIAASFLTKTLLVDRENITILDVGFRNRYNSKKVQGMKASLTSSKKNPTSWFEGWGEVNFVAYIEKNASEKTDKLVIVYSGSNGQMDWISNISLGRMDFHGLRIHNGIGSLCEEAVVNSHNVLISKVNTFYKSHEAPKNLEINIMGHSQGGALALFTAYYYEIKADYIDIIKNKSAKRSVKTFTFGAPPVVDERSINIIETALKKENIYRIWDIYDPIVMWPKRIPFYGMEHVGTSIPLYNIDKHSYQYFDTFRFGPHSYDRYESHLHALNSDYQTENRINLISSIQSSFEQRRKPESLSKEESNKIPLVNYKAKSENIFTVFSNVWMEKREKVDRHLFHIEDKETKKFLRNAEKKINIHLLTDSKDLRGEKLPIYYADSSFWDCFFPEFYEKDFPVKGNENELKTPYVAPSEEQNQKSQNDFLINEEIKVSFDDNVQLYYLSKNDDSHPETIIKGKTDEKDERVPIFDTSSPPYSFVGYMEMTFPIGNTYIGSGTLVGPNHVLTAGGNIYNKKLGGWATKVTFYAGRNKKFCKEQALGTVLLSKYGWTNNGCKEDDMGMVILNTPIGYKTGWAGVSSLSDSILSQYSINVTGYPGDEIKENKQVTMWDMVPISKKLTTDRLFYGIDGGQSGSPLWGENEYRKEKGYYTCGIHVCGDQTTNENSATRINNEKFLLILDWLKNYSLLDSHHPMLKTIFWNAIRIKDDDIEKLSRDIKKGWYRDLSTLRLPGNLIGPIGIKNLSDSLSSCKFLGILELSSNPIMDDGAMHLSKFFSNSNGLTSLFLRNCSITDKGAISILDLISSPKLSHLDLGLNALGDNVLISFADKICEKEKKESLYFGFDINYATDKGAIHLVKKIRNIQKNIKIHIAWNKIGSKGISYLKTIEDKIYTEEDDYTVQAWSYFRYFAIPFIINPVAKFIDYQGDHKVLKGILNKK